LTTDYPMTHTSITSMVTDSTRYFAFCKGKLKFLTMSTQCKQSIWCAEQVYTWLRIHQNALAAGKLPESYFWTYLEISGVETHSNFTCLL